MESLLQEILANSKANRSKVEHALSVLSAIDREELTKALMDESIKLTVVHRVLARRGIIVKYDRLSEYRRELRNVSE